MAIIKKSTINCQKCKNIFETKLSKTFTGFPKAKCPKCGKTTLLPLGKGYKTIYTLLIAWFVLAVIYNIATQNYKDIFVFSIGDLALLLVGTWALLNNRKIIKAQG